MFCYFLAFFFLGCGGKTPEKKVGPETQVEQENNTAASGSKKKILFFGDSLTAGYGLELGQSYPSVIQQKIDSLDLGYQVVNAGLSGETTASGKNRLEWVLETNMAIVIIELGANDGLRGVPLQETESNLRAMVEMVQEKLPDAQIILAGMKIPPNMGPEYTSTFEGIFPALATEEDVLLIPFLLENVAGIPGLNQGDGIHPTVEGQKIVAQNVWEVLKPIL